MCQHLTPSETALWSQISRNQLGVASRRQVLIGNGYIVDFLAPSIKKLWLKLTGLITLGAVSLKPGENVT